MRVAIASLQQESNSFSPRLTSLPDFQASYLCFGDEVRGRLAERPFEIGGAYAAAAEEGTDLVPILACWAMPSGPLTRDTYSYLRGELLSRLRAAGPVDGVLLVLHGAMAVEGLDDPEGDLLAAVRRIIGLDLPLVATLDLHANVTRQMLDSASALVGYHTVPHVDHFDTGYRAARLLTQLVREKIRPVVGFRKLPMITPAHTHDVSREPFRGLMEEVLALEQRPGILAAGLYPVQPWLDLPELGWSTLVFAENDQPQAQAEADRLGAMAWERRREFLVEPVPIPEAILRALQVDGQPVVFSDTGDGSAGGAPGDSAAILTGLLEEGPPCTALLDIVDAPAVARAFAAGVGASLRLTLGGTLDSARQSPVSVEARVRLLSDGRFVIRGQALRGYQANLGLTAVLELGPVSVVAHQRGEMNIDPAFYRSLGLEPLRAKIVQVKSFNGFRAAYEPIAADIVILDSPGCTTVRFEQLPYRRAPRPLFPLDERAEVT